MRINQIGKGATRLGGGNRAQVLSFLPADRGLSFDIVLFLLVCLLVNFERDRMETILNPSITSRILPAFR